MLFFASGYPDIPRTREGESRGRGKQREKEIIGDKQEGGPEFRANRIAMSAVLCLAFHGMIGAVPTGKDASPLAEYVQADGQEREAMT